MADNFRAAALRYLFTFVEGVPRAQGSKQFRTAVRDSIVVRGTWRRISKRRCKRFEIGQPRHLQSGQWRNSYLPQCLLGRCPQGI